ncbi:MAG: T9SS type A sorting domain-containing protein [Bacteroidetes bacterium]|nr:T9SS type A sorting domain-containing protein [Bacteroidota bacterium]
MNKFLFFTVIFFSLLFGEGFCQSTSKAPSAASNVNIFGSIGWTNLNGAFSSGGTSATSVSELKFAFDQTDYIVFTGFNFNIPTNSIVNGIAISIVRRAITSSSSSLRDNVVQLQRNGAGVGNNRATNTNWAETIETANYGSAADKWGLTHTPASVNASDFGVRISVYRSTIISAAQQYPEIDFIQMTVHYTSTLPVELINFSASSLYDDVKSIQWSTATEVNSQKFSLSKSLDGINYQEIHNEMAAGYSNSVLNYEYMDRESNDLSNVIYYKLQQTDFDGASKEYGPISLVINSPDLEFSLYPNPSSDFVNFYYDKENIDVQTVEIYNLQGQLVAQHDLKYSTSINVSNLKSGTYIFKVFNLPNNKSIIKHFSKITSY